MRAEIVGLYRRRFKHRLKIRSAPSFHSPSFVPVVVLLMEPPPSLARASFLLTVRAKLVLQADNMTENDRRDVDTEVIGRCILSEMTRARSGHPYKPRWKEKTPTRNYAGMSSLYIRRSVAINR